MGKSFTFTFSDITHSRKSGKCTGAVGVRRGITYTVPCKCCMKKWRCFSVRKPKLVPYETIVRATSSEPEAIQPPHSPALVFPGSEIRLHQQQVLKDGADIYLTRLEYGALCYLAASPRWVFTKTQIFESVWSMESESCQSSVASVICNLRKKIEPLISGSQRQEIKERFSVFPFLSNISFPIRRDDNVCCDYCCLLWYAGCSTDWK